MQKPHQSLPFLPITQAIAASTKKILRSATRKESGLMLVEGEKCCEELLLSDKFKIDYVICNADNLSPIVRKLAATAHRKHATIYTAKSDRFAGLCDAKSPQGIIAIASQTVKPALLPGNSFVLLDNVSDPGNVGTIIRTCDWFGVPQVLLAGACADYRSPKVIRAAMGSTFKLNIIPVEDEIAVLKKYFSNVRVYAATLSGKQTLHEITGSRPFGLVVGNESHGVSPEITAIVSCFHIQGAGQAESLNVAIATGIALYELAGNV